MSEVTVGAALIVGPDTLEELRGLLPQLSQLDQIVVVDSSGQGAIRNYVKKFKNVTYKAIVWRPEAADYGLNEWGFGWARNEAFKLLTTTHALWIDTDDRIGAYVNGKEHHATAAGVKKALVKLAIEAPKTDLWSFDYVYSQNEHGNANVVHARGCFVRMAAQWTWVNPIHESIVPFEKPQYTTVKDIKVFHHPKKDRPSSSERNMRMLKDWLQQLEKTTGAGQHDLSRCRMLIGETYWGQEDYEQCIAWLRGEYLAKHPETADLEKWVALCFIARSGLYLGDIAVTKQAALEAIEVEPSLMDGYLLLAEAKMMGDENPQDVLTLIETAAGKENAPPEVVQNPLDYRFTPFLVASEAKYQLGQYDAALDYALKAQEEVPAEPRAEKARLKAADAVRKRDAEKAALALYEYLVMYDENEKAARLYEFLPYVTQFNKSVFEVAKLQAERASHLGNLEVYKNLHNQAGIPDYQERKEKGIIPGWDVYNYIKRRLEKNGIKPMTFREEWPDSPMLLVIEHGDIALQLARDGYKVMYVDIHEKRGAQVFDQAVKEGLLLSYHSGMFEIIDLDQAGWFQMYDAVIAPDYLHKAQKPGPAMGTLGDCAKDGAPVILSVPNGAWDDGDVPLTRSDNAALVLRSFTQESLEDFLVPVTEYRVWESHFLPYTHAYREGQGWQVAEVKRGGHPVGPRVRIFCGDACRPFSPDNLITGEGIGGSETAVIQMATNFAKRDCVVAVYGTTVGIYDGVLYRHAEDFVLEQRSHLFIAWRLPHLFRLGRPNAETTVLWNHDLYYPMHIPEEWVEHIDKIAVLSEFHRDYLHKSHPQFPLEKMWVTRNGIDPERYQTCKPKKGYQYFFSSSYERGLKELAEIWPALRERIPEATLHVAYGTNTAEKMNKGNHVELKKMRDFFRKLDKTEGIVNHGELNQKELAQLQMECEAWLYPSQHIDDWHGEQGFLETYCISAVEAQAAMAYPICRENGALKETVKDHIYWHPEMDVDRLCDFLTLIHDGHFAAKLITNREWALSQTWETLADDWLKALRPIEVHTVA